MRKFVWQNVEVEGTSGEEKQENGRKGGGWGAGSEAYGGDEAQYPVGEDINFFNFHGRQGKMGINREYEKQK